jgi:predicted double-glycine peptidase
MFNQRVRSLIASGLCLGAAASAFGERPPARDPDKTFRQYVWSYKELSQVGVVMQKRDYSCGAAALATVCRYYWGDDVTEDTFLALLPNLLPPDQIEERIKNGLALSDLKKVANKAGYEASLGKLTFEKLAESKAPLVVGLVVKGHEHFVVFRGTDWEYAYLADSIRGNVRTRIPEFLSQWQKNAVLVVAKEDTDPPTVNRIAVRETEAYRGELNEHTMNRVPLAPNIPYHIQPFP